MSNDVELAKAAQRIGYAIGVLSAVAELSGISQIQKDAIMSAAEDLREIDLLALRAGVKDE